MSSADPTAGCLLEPALMARLDRLALSARKVQLGVAKGERKSKRKGVSTDFADYRDYVQGDDLRHVDWNLYGRLDSLHLKVYQDQEDLTLTLLLDASESMLFGAPTKFEFARKLAVALGYVALARYDRVVVEAFSDGAHQRLEPCRGRAAVRKFFAFMEGLQARGGTQLDAACRALAARQPKKGVTMIISDFFDESGFEGPLRQLTQCGEVYAIQVLAPEELDPRLSGDLKLIDAETGGFAEISVTGALLDAYQQRREEFTGAIRQYCNARGMGHFLVSSATPVDSFVLDTLRRGGVLR